MGLGFGGAGAFDGGIHVVPLEGPDSAPRLMKNSDLILTAQDRALAWGYVNKPFDKMPTVEQLKAALEVRGFQQFLELWQLRVLLEELVLGDGFDHGPRLLDLQNEVGRGRDVLQRIGVAQ